MSFRLFVYYCALIGGWSAFVGWALARPIPFGDHTVLEVAVYGLTLGLCVGGGLGLVDAMWNYSLRQFGPVMLRVGTALAVGMIGGFVSMLVVGLIFYSVQEFGHRWLSGLVFLFGWIFLGLLMGVAVSAFDVIAAAVSGNLMNGVRKLIKCVIGGTAGGVVGGLIAYVLRFLIGPLLNDPTGNSLWTPTSLGFVALASFVGLLVGLSQVILKEAWIKVEQGFRAGREMVLTKDRIIIGRAEGSDVALFGDMTVEKQHATIVLQNGTYSIEPANAAATFVNDKPVNGRVTLNTGDLIRVGKSLLRFNERRKRSGS